MVIEINSKLNQKELEFVSYLASNPKKSQRSMSTSLGYSLGLTNIILKRLIKMGYIKTIQLNKKKVEYILTPKGFIEKSKKSYDYFLKTIDSLRVIKTCITNIVSTLYANGEKKFYIAGNNELADITEIAIRDMKKNDTQCVLSNNNSEPLLEDYVVLITDKSKERDMSAKIIVDIIDELSHSLH